MKGKFKNILLIVFIIGILVTGCASGKKSHTAESQSAPMEDFGNREEIAEDTGDYEDSMVAGEVGFGQETPKRNTNQKLIHRASMNVEIVEKLEPIMVSIQNFVEGHDGYIENMEQYRSGYDPITQEQLEAVFLKIRIPHEHYNKALQTIADLGTVVNKNRSVEDVTIQYSDIESTLKMYKVEQDRLLKMLENDTTDVKDMIEIEKRLSEVRVELEKQESARRGLESQINYDTIELEMREVRRVSDDGIRKTFGSRVKTALRDSIDGVIIFFQTLVLIATYMAIPITIIVIIFGTAYMIVTKIIKRKKNKLASKNENNAD
ncbi:MAG TPA: DUF4349 domain-containing protein [Epulopiscium sp.]|nr:DUF4349 domain-containing protein [Candidatus Epulonipiscium sp.]